MSPWYSKPQGLNCAIPTFAAPDPRIASFHRGLSGYAPTELVSLHQLAKELNVGHVLLKKETSRLGLPAFKILGASWAAYCALTKHLGLTLDLDRSIEDLALIVKDHDITLVAATDGNHGRAVARMAALLGVQCDIYVPEEIDISTREYIAGEGARVEVVRGDYDMAVQVASEAASKLEGGILIQDTTAEGYQELPQKVVDGYSTTFEEIDSQLTELTGGKQADIVIVPVGVGSLAQAAVMHYKQPERSGKTKIVTVEPHQQNPNFTWGVLMLLEYFK